MTLSSCPCVHVTMQAGTASGISWNKIAEMPCKCMHTLSLHACTTYTYSVCVQCVTDALSLYVCECDSAANVAMHWMWAHICMISKTITAKQWNTRRAQRRKTTVRRPCSKKLVKASVDEIKAHVKKYNDKNPNQPPIKFEDLQWMQHAANAQTNAIQFQWISTFLKDHLRS